MFIEIEKKKELVEEKMSPVIMDSSIKDNLLLEWTYHSNALEGNSLTLADTEMVLNGHSLVGKSVREQLDVINHQQAVMYVEKLASLKEPFSESHIKQMHRILLKGIDNQNAGVYRKENITLNDEEFDPPVSLQVPRQMEDLIRWYGIEAQYLHPITRAAKLHVFYLNIFPFNDGNGPIARLLLNLELMKNGYPPIVIKKQRETEYRNALEKTFIKENATENYDDFIKLILEELNGTLDLYLN